MENGWVLRPSRGWQIFALVYCATVIGMFVVFRLSGNEVSYIVMLAALLPTIFLTYVPIYVVVATLDYAVGSGTDGSAISDLAFMIGIALTALVNVGIMRLLFSVGASCRLRRRSVTTA